MSILDAVLKSIDEYVLCGRLYYVGSFLLSKDALDEKRKFLNKRPVASVRISPKSVVCADISNNDIRFRKLINEALKIGFIKLITWRNVY